ncbi:polynucleotide kinase-phosphatase [Qipengyuania flava]|uniref:polynucleotide kinase-phosphatase n=1 Tax=Qipengyuania flava TaxID=192812 RepID=UPI001C59D176|nr:polynucleotide kinase-phosphatase [Qipengyuania flava]MBW3169107.1 polynucleotide kinase-phosphatase [Qipengyuania flava]MBY5966345.1 polynucleotide kinase-phosphatase [Qipengyuania flava]MBY6012669.1 polynucleotide kinase-phosphatase [Qipengyuania flava]MBY6027111.1 polynucleotide kinase-phosphatase [Qipengyuania flava]
MKIEIPEYALVLLVGASGTGKSSFAAKHFLPTEVISSDRMRGWVADDETDQSATGDAFDVLRYVTEKRLKARRFTVIDATNVQPEARRGLIALAKKWHALAVAIVFDLPEAIAIERNAARPDRQFGAGPVKRQTQALKRSMGKMKREGLRFVHRLRSVEEIDAVEIVRTRLWTDRRGETGPFDIIGDVHGCCDELETLLDELGYAVSWDGKSVTVTPPEGRRAIFVGDLVDRGPRSPDALRIAKHMVEAGTGLCVLGNHDDKLKRHLSGRNVKQTHGLAETVEQFAGEPPEFAAEMREWLDGLISHYVLDGGKLVVAHAGIKEAMQGRASGAIRSFCMYGETTGEIDEFGLPVRSDWAADYKGNAKVVYGHTPVVEANWVNGTLCIDTGCVFGGKLTALRYPELDLVEVPAARTYYEPIRPLEAPQANTGLAANQLDLADVLGKQSIDTRHYHRVTVREDNAAAALEVMSRYAVDPRWLIYLPPTMSPAETSARDGWLERPEEAFAYYGEKGVRTLVAEEKHMGSRGLIVLSRTQEVAAKRFGISDGSRGVVVTRTGRRFFKDAKMEAQALHRIDAAMEASGLWDELATDWVLWDAEILPWSMKASSLVRGQYAAVGAAATSGLAALDEAFSAARKRGVAVDDLSNATTEKLADAKRYRDAYNQYVAPFEGIEDLRIAPFHLLASEGSVHDEKDHVWHMEMAHRLAKADPALLIATRYRQIDLDDEQQVADAIAWWEAMTADGGEGMVVKPRDFVARGRKGLLQPAVKCRGREYLRIIYGPHYDRPENLERLKKRGLGHKRSMALREFALGLEALHRFVEHEPLTRVHQCVFGVLAMESEPVDPRL